MVIASNPTWKAVGICTLLTLSQQLYGQSKARVSCVQKHALRVCTYKPSDTCTITQKSSQIRLAVRSKTGIGSLCLIPQKKANKDVHLLFWLNGFESCTLTFGQNGGVCELNESSSSLPKRIESTYSGKVANHLKPVKAKKGRSIKTQKSYYSILVPAEYLQHVDSLHVQWIDFYRH